MSNKTQSPSITNPSLSAMCCVLTWPLNSVLTLWIISPFAVPFNKKSWYVLMSANTAVYTWATPPLWGSLCYYLRPLLTCMWTPELITCNWELKFYRGRLAHAWRCVSEYPSVLEYQSFLCALFSLCLIFIFLLFYFMVGCFCFSTCSRNWIKVATVRNT